MANIKSAIKRIKINKLRNKINNSKRSILKKFFKKTKQALIIQNKELAIKYYRILQSYLDKFSLKNIIHRNKASRYKSKLMKLLNLLLLK